MSLQSLTAQWKVATGKLSWGVQKVFHDVFVLASEGKTTLAYGADYNSDGAPCLVNTVGVMLKATGGKGDYGLPAQHFGEIVSLFDQINDELFNRQVNTQYKVVSPMAAEVFLYHFADLKEKPEPGSEIPEGTYVEPTDEAMAEALVNLFQHGPSDEDIKWTEQELLATRVNPHGTAD